MEKLKSIFDAETWKVVGVAILPPSLTLAQLNTIIQIIVGIGSAIYVWRKVFKKNKNDTDL